MKTYTCELLSVLKSLCETSEFIKYDLKYYPLEQ